MFNSDVEYENYAKADEEETRLKDDIINKKDVVVVCLYLFDNNLDFIKLDEPYRSGRKERILKWFDIDDGSIKNCNVNQSRIKLADNYAIFKQIQKVFGFCCMSNSDAVIFNKYVFANELRGKA